MISFAFLISILLACAFTLKNKTVVRQVHVVSRHCDTTPFNDLSIPVVGPLNFVELLGEPPRGELTNLGVSNCAMLGSLIRARYIDADSPFRVSGLSDRYTTNVYNFSATTASRSIKSSSALSQGLFPPLHSIGAVIDSVPQTPRSQLPSSLPNSTTVISIRSTRPSNDIVLRATDECPFYQQRVSQYFTTDASWRSFETSLQPQILALCSELGIAPSDIDHFQSDWSAIWDYINSVRVHGLWNNISTSSLHFLNSLHEQIISHSFTRDLIGNFGGGFLMSSIWSSMSRLRNLHQPPEPLFYHYMGNPSTILSLLTALRLSVDYPQLTSFPLSGTTTAFELHQELGNGKWYLRFVFLKDPAGNGSVANQPEWIPYRFLSLGNMGCESEYCEYDTFDAIVQDAIPFDWCGECDNQGTEECMREQLSSLAHHKTITWVVTGIVFVITLVLFGFFPVMLIRDICSRPKREYSYMPG